MNRRNFIKSTAILGAGLSVPLMAKANTPELYPWQKMAINRMTDGNAWFISTPARCHGKPLTEKTLLEAVNEIAKIEYKKYDRIS